MALKLLSTYLLFCSNLPSAAESAGTEKKEYMHKVKAKQIVILTNNNNLKSLLLRPNFMFFQSYRCIVGTVTEFTKYC